MTEIDTIDWLGMWGTSVFTENTAILFKLKSVLGTYKPRIRCYDVHQMSLKFERGLDSDVVKFQFLSEDYTKVKIQQSPKILEQTDMGKQGEPRSDCP